MTSQQIAEELRPLVRGRIAADTMSRQLLSTDASPFQILPDAVFTPLDDDDIQAAIRFCFERGIPFTPRGAGTGYAGESLNAGLVVDLSVHFRKILELGDGYARIQAGTTLRELNDALAATGRRCPIELPNANAVTLGGMIATDAAGFDQFRTGSISGHVLSLKILTDSGEIETIEAPSFRSESGRAALIRGLLQENADAIRKTVRHPFCRAGYRIHDLLSPNGVDLLKLLAGSEGTLATVLEATIRTVPNTDAVAKFVIGFSQFDDALNAGLQLRNHDGIVAAELVDQRSLVLSRAGKDLTAPPDLAAALIITHRAASESEALKLAIRSFDAIRIGQAILLEPTTRPPFISMQGSASKGPRRPEPVVEAVAVDPERLPQFLGVAQQLLREAELSASFLTNPLTGAVQCRPIVDLTRQADQAKAWPLADHLYEVALAFGGTIASRHGLGLARTPWIEKQFPMLMPVFREIKRIFDPKNILNPGKIVGPDPARPAWPFRVEEKAGVLPLSLLDEPQLREELDKCNTCGDCRTRSLPERMCPVFRVSGDEAASPRAKVNAFRGLMQGQENLNADELQGVAKLCNHCTRCRDDCLNKVDVPSLMLEAKAAHFAVHGHDRGEWLIARTERLAALAGTFAFTANMMLAWRPTRWIFEKLLGLSRKRMLHRFTHRTFLRRRLVQRLFRRESPGSRKFAYFVDSFANYNDPLVAEATVAVLEYHGFRVAVPRRQKGSGLAPLSVGDVERARRAAEYNVRTFAELVRDGYTVVCSEPAAALMIKTEYPRLLKTDDAQLVAFNTIELTALLGQLQDAGELKPPLKSLPHRVGHHAPCHLKSLGSVNAPKLLSLIPGFDLAALDAGCSGSAGPWGLTKTNIDLSLQIGQPVFEAFAGQSFGATECGTCRMQVQQGTGLRVLHPVQWLALSYGLVPKLEARLKRRLHPRLSG